MTDDRCCPGQYACPSSGEQECPTHGGFGSCCADRTCPGFRPLTRRAWLHRTMRHRAQQAGYWLRPYDMLADRRRWAWQPRQRCGLGGVPADIRKAILDAASRMPAPTLDPASLDGLSPEARAAYDSRRAAITGDHVETSRSRATLADGAEVETITWTE